jgi:integrase
MASIGKYDKNSPFWYAAFTDPLGRRLKKSTEQTSKSKAWKVARTWEKASEEAAQLRLTEVRAREVISELMRSVGGESLRVFTVEQWFEHFVKGKKKSRAVGTGKRHAQTMREFMEFLGPRAKLNIAAITSRDIASFRDRRHALGLAPATVNLDVAILSSAFNGALRQGHITVNPCLAIEPLKNKPPRKGVFSPEQVAALLKAAEGDWCGLIMVAFYTGQRLVDCANLRWRNIDLLGDIKTIRFQVRKSDSEVVTVIHPALEDYLLSLPAAKTDDAFVFPTLAERSTARLSNLFRRIMEKARIEHRVIREKSGAGRCVNALSFHSLRHSFSSILANAGVSEELRMTIVGHASRDMQQKYTHHELARLRDAISVLPTLNSEPNKPSKPNKADLLSGKIVAKRRLR